MTQTSTTTETTERSFPTVWYGIEFTNEEMAILRGRRGMKGVTTLILDKGLQARKAGGAMTEDQQISMMRCMKLLIAARDFPAAVAANCDPMSLAEHLGVSLEEQPH